MYALDFAYDKQYLSDYGFIVCDFDNKNGANIASAGSKLTFKTIPHNDGKKYSLTSAKYDECIQAIFDICKDPDKFDAEDMWISDDEYRDLMRWLNRKQFLMFQPIIEDDFNAEQCTYEGSFNIETIRIRETLYGLRLTLTTNRPFGYGMERKYQMIFDAENTTFCIKDHSDEIGVIYSKIEITCNGDGNLAIANDLTGSNMVIKNCIRNEVITIDGANHLISTDVDSHDICNDFNYDYLSIGNTISSKNNNITASLPCKIKLSYFPIIKTAP